jgi:translation initiation factor IF-1
VPPATEPSGDPTTVHTSSKTGKYTIRINGEKRKDYDISVRVGDSFTITLVDSDGNKQDVTWSASNTRASINGNKITCSSSGTVKISCVIDGEKYTCIVRVSK